MIASLPMYWRAETADAWTRLWHALRGHAQAEGLDLPGLTAPEDLPAKWTDHWLSDTLALSQTCGLPFRTALKSKVTYVATFDFDLGVPPGHYMSYGVVAADHAPEDPLTTLAYNAPDSQSGWAAVPRRDRFKSLVETGAHAASARMVAQGKADIAYLDAVTWRILQRFTDLGTRLKVIEHTAPTPGLPLITAQPEIVAQLRRALHSAVQGLSKTDAADLGRLRGVAVLDEAAYFAVPVPPAPADMTRP